MNEVGAEPCFFYLDFHSFNHHSLTKLHRGPGRKIITFLTPQMSKDEFTNDFEGYSEILTLQEENIQNYKNVKKYIGIKTLFKTHAQNIAHKMEGNKLQCCKQLNITIFFHQLFIFEFKVEISWCDNYIR